MRPSGVFRSAASGKDCPDTTVLAELLRQFDLEMTAPSPHAASVQEVGPILLHLCASFQMLGVVVGGAYGIPGGMGKLEFDVLMRVALLMKDGGCHAAEAMARHSPL
jgi:hypothetical protein